MTPTALALLVLAVAVGGALGAAARLWLSDRVTRWQSGDFPWGTLVVNLSGAFAIGLLAGWRGIPPPGAVDDLAWVGLVIGLLGSFTTVSSFALQTLQLGAGGRRRAAVGNTVASVLGCLLLAIMGLAVGAGLGGG
jgi:fluoride exporter